MPKAPLRNVLFGLGLGARLAVAALLSEAVALCLDCAASRLPVSAWLLAVLMAAFVLALGGAALGLAAGLLAAFVGGRSFASDLAGARFWSALDALATRDDAARRAFVSRLVAWCLWLPAGFALALVPAKALVTRIETPAYAAILIVGAAFGCLAASLVVWPVWLRTGELVARLRARWPSPALVLAAGLGAILAAGLAVTAVTWSSVGRYVPWRAPLTLASTFVLAAALLALEARLRPGRRVRAIALGAWLALVLAGLLVAAYLPQRFSRAGTVVAEADGPLAPCYAALASLLDRDRDGYLSWMGGGDCAPGDPGVHPGAAEKPGDRVDRNCDGRLTRLVREAMPGRHDYPATPKPVPMPVVLVTLDATSAGHLNLYGYERPTMPRLAQRAKGAAVFEWAFSQGPSTRLSIPAMMTSRYDTQIARSGSGRANSPWSSSTRTLADVLARSGYDTAAVAPDSYFATRIRWVYQGFKTVDTSPARGTSAKSKTSAAVTDAALGLLDRLAGKRTFFLWTHYSDAHGPHVLPPAETPFPGGREVDVYDREIEMTDRQVDRLLAAVEERLSGTPHVVIVTADHGEAFDEDHSNFRHGHDLSGDVTRVPLIVFSPYSGGRRIDRVASTLDIMPTILNMVGLRGGRLSGDSLLPSIEGRKVRPRPILQQFFLPEYEYRGKDPLVRLAVREGRYVLHTYMVNGAESLFDFRSDPHEDRNVIAQHRDVAERLASARDTFMSWARPDPARKNPAPPKPKPKRKRGAPREP
jgi:arylsulfatase A-like enzyme